METKNNTGGGGITFFGLLQIVFIVLKLLGVIKWSWWLVLLPLWIDLALVAIMIAWFVWVTRR